MALGGWGGALALLHAHDPKGSPKPAGSPFHQPVSPRAGSAAAENSIDWRSSGWLEIASAVEKPVMVVNSELATRTDEAVSDLQRDVHSLSLFTDSRTLPLFFACGS
jgi:hypothetical protein